MNTNCPRPEKNRIILLIHCTERSNTPGSVSIVAMRYWEPDVLAFPLV